MQILSFILAKDPGICILRQSLGNSQAGVKPSLELLLPSNQMPQPGPKLGAESVQLQFTFLSQGQGLTHLP